MATMLERNKKAKTPVKTREEHAEDALYREVWEEVNNEKTLKFIKKYSRHIFIAAFCIMIVVTGIQIGVRTYRANKLAMARNYEVAIENIDANALAGVANNASGATADLALFQSYLLDKDINKLEQLANKGNSRDFRDLARLHIVTIRGDHMTGAQVEEYLADLDTENSPFYYTAAMTVAQKYLSENNRDAANKWLDKIINDKNAPAAIAGNAQILR